MKKEENAGVIRHEDFVFIPSTHANDRFDLFQEGKGKGGKTTRKLIGYGYRFGDAVEKMIGVGLSDHKGERSIRDYVIAFRQAVTEVQNLLK